MHRSRLHVVLIDTPPGVSDREVAFWAGALGQEPDRESGTPFTDIARFAGGEILAHQQLQSGHARIHLDIETDDTAAEVRRLEALGALRVGEHDGVVQLRDPAGLVFCVVPVQSDDFEEHARSWA
jgi:Glyoxalase-like domain